LASNANWLRGLQSSSDLVAMSRSAGAVGQVGSRHAF
jgi:hypothetical protein